MENGKIMFQAERQERILEYINTNKKVRTKELSRIFNTSMVTIRADLNDLDEKGMIIKAHGGAMAISDRLNLEIPSQSKSRHNIDAKRPSPGRPPIWSRRTMWSSWTPGPPHWKSQSSSKTKPSPSSPMT